MPNGSSMPNTEKDLKDCEASAAYWASRLPEFARSMNSRANWFEIAGILLAALTGAGLWATVIAGSTELWTQAVAAIAALVAAALAGIPKAFRYRDRASAAAPLAAEYGAALSQIRTALDYIQNDKPDTEARAKEAQETFHAVKGKKDATFPDIKGERQ